MTVTVMERITKNTLFGGTIDYLDKYILDNLTLTNDDKQNLKKLGWIHWSQGGFYDDRERS